MTLRLSDDEAARLFGIGSAGRLGRELGKRVRQGTKRGESPLELAFAAQLRAFGITGWAQEVELVPGRKWRFDFAFQAERIAVEIDGATWANGRHNRGSGIEDDALKVSEAAARGFRTLRITRRMIESGVGIRLVEEALRWREEGKP